MRALNLYWPVYRSRNKQLLFYLQITPLHQTCVMGLYSTFLRGSNMTIFFLLLALIVKIISIVIPFSTPKYVISDVKKSAKQSLLLILMEFVISVLLLFFLGMFMFYRNIQYIGSVLVPILFDFIFISIVLVAVYQKKESLCSIGITKVNLIKSIIVGFFLGFCTIVIFSLPTSNKTININTASLISLFKFTIVGFSEEIIFRGYLQIRLIAWKGTNKALFLTAFIFSFFHFSFLFIETMNVYAAFWGCLRLIPMSLLLGYIMIKTKNIVTTSILHTIWNWIVNL